MKTTTLCKKSMKSNNIEDYNLIKIPIMYDNKLIIYNIEIIDRDGLINLINEIRDNDLSDNSSLHGVLDYDSYIKYIKEIIKTYKIAFPKEKIKNGIVKYEIKVWKLPRIYNILKELFSFSGQRSLDKLACYLSDLINCVSLNENSPLQVEINDASSILEAISEIGNYVIIKDKENYIIDSDVELERYDLETLKRFITIGKINGGCVETGIFEMSKLKKKIKVKM